MKNQLLIYNDEGSGKDSLNHLKNCLCQFFQHKYKVKFVNAAAILTTNWQENCRVILFGGGYDLGFLKKLKIQGCKMIKDFVYSGGIYIGICAGAYFASNYIEFDKGGEFEVVGERFIKLFNGTARGPIFPGFNYQSRQGVHATKICSTISKMKINSMYVMYEGGCLFTPAFGFENISILYNYEGRNDAAIIHSKIGNGQALLSGVHFEYNINNIDFELSSSTREKLQIAEPFRLALVENLFDYLQLKIDE